MKNLYILQTDKPSRIKYTYGNNYALSKEHLSWRYAHHIYIISDEEIEKGWEGYAYKEDVDGLVFKHFYTTNDWYKDAKKIILTTDQDLIKDGVQAIEDEFIQWFIDNPKCEEVNVYEKNNNEIERELNIHGHDIGLTENEYAEWLKNGGQLYKIIIPKEEPKGILCGEADKFHMCVNCGSPCGSEGHFIEVNQDKWKVLENSNLDTPLRSWDDNQETNQLYSEIENLIIVWELDGTKTAGSLTREIMSLIKKP